MSDRHQILKIFNKSLIIILSVASKCDCPRWFLHRPSLSDNVDKRMIADTQMYYSRFTNFLNIGCKNKINQSLGCFGYSGGLLNKLSHLDLKHKEFQSSRLRQTTLHVTIKITKYQTFLLFCCLELSSKLVIESLISWWPIYWDDILGWSAQERTDQTRKSNRLKERVPKFEVDCFSALYAEFSCFQRCSNRVRLTSV